MTRFVCMADTHCAHRELAVPMGEVLIHAGDALCDGTRREAEDFFAWLALLPHPIKIYVPGNHDEIFFWDEAGARDLVPSGVTLLVGERATLDDGLFSVFGAPWVPGDAPSPDRRGHPTAMAFSLPDGERGRLWDGLRGTLDVLVCHAPPLASAPRAGDHLVDKVIARTRPRLVVCGHVHEARGVRRVETAPGLETVVVNAACSGPAPEFAALPPLVIDL